MKLKYTNIACGGTFDFFHAGHATFLKKAFSLSQHVYVGITSDHFASTFGKYPYNHFSERKFAVEKFLNVQGFRDRSDFIKLDDIFGPAKIDKTLQGIIVTKDSINGALKINTARRVSGFGSLDIIKCELIKADDGFPISSSRIVAGELSLDGLNYFKFLKKRDFFLPEKLRPTLAKPFGEIMSKFTKTKDSNLLISVGDQTTSGLLSAGIVPDVSVIDYKIQRFVSFQSFVDLGFDPKIQVFNAKNPQGSITKNLSEALEKSIHFKNKCVVVVEGEEDLAVLPAVLLSPMGTSIYYGLRDKGLIKITVELECKNNFLKLLSKFNFR